MDFKLTTLRALAKKHSYENERARIRFLALIELCHRCDGDLSVLRSVDFESVGAKFNHSGRSVQRWLSQYLLRGERGLIAKKAPGRKRRGIRGRTRKLILRYRRNYGWGARVIQVHLRAWHDIEVGFYRIQSLLRDQNLLRRRRRKKRSKHTRKVVVRIPGAHTQMDVKYYPQRLGDGSKAYVYNFKDHASRWTYKRAFSSLGAAETHEFFLSVIKNFPQRIWSVQTDNGSEFTNRYLSHIDAPKEHILDRICRERFIRHRLIPPGEKELQGLVERSHREDEEELYHRIKPRTLDELNLILEEHCEWANQRRHRSAIGWRTAENYLVSYRAAPEEYREDLAILMQKLDPWIRPRAKAQSL